MMSVYFLLKQVFFFSFCGPLPHVFVCVFFSAFFLFFEYFWVFSFLKRHRPTRFSLGMEMSRLFSRETKFSGANGDRKI